jgi:hypothetical protein
MILPEAGQNKESRDTDSAFLIRDGGNRPRPARKPDGAELILPVSPAPRAGVRTALPDIIPSPDILIRPGRTLTAISHFRHGPSRQAGTDRTRASSSHATRAAGAMPRSHTGLL